MRLSRVKRVGSLLGFASLIALHILACLTLTTKAQTPERARYIVVLEQSSVVERALSTGWRPTRTERLELTQNSNWTGYWTQLEALQQQLIQRVTAPLPSDEPTNSVRVSSTRIVAQRAFLLNFLVVEGGAGIRRRLLEQPGVRAVVAVELREPLLDAAPSLLNAPVVWEALGGDQEAGRGVRIGIIDSGVTVGHPMFDDADLEFPGGFPLDGQDLVFVNRKVIVARAYPELYPKPQPNQTPQDETSHGTRVASVAAGRLAQAPLGEVSGIAPMAWVGSYKVFGSPSINPSATNASIIAAVNDAVADGMDVINLSLGGTARPPANDPEQQAIRLATQLGVVVVISAGNQGPGPGTVKSPGTSPEAITVGAVSNQRAFRSLIQLEGPVLPPGGLNQVAYLAGAGISITTPFGPSLLRSVIDFDPTGEACGALSPGALAASVALIRRGNCTFQIKVDNALASGAIAAVVYNNLVGADPFTMGFQATPTIPAVMIGNFDGVVLRDFLATAALVPITIRPTSETVSFPAAADVLAGFSSRGPSIVEAVKPDVSAVGQGVYAASNDGVGYRRNSNGTSFSAPMVAGAAALIRQLHPDWSVPEIKSALVNSAVQTPIADGDPASVNQSGAGRIDLERAAAVNLVLDPVSISFGFLRGAETALSHQRRLTMRNLSSQPQTLRLSYEALKAPEGLQILVPEEAVLLAPGEARELDIVLVPPAGATSVTFEGYLRVQQGNGLRLTVPLWGGLVVQDPFTVLSVGGRPGDFPTLQTALDSAMPGNVIEVEAGSYSENVTLKLNAAELPHDGVTLRGGLTGETMIRAADNGEAVIDVRDVEGFRLEGLRLSGGDRSVAVRRASGFIVDNRMEETVSGGFGLLAFEAHVLVADNEFFGLRGNAAALLGSQGLFVGNLFGGQEERLNQLSGLFLDSGSRVSLFENVFNGNGLAGVNVSGGQALIRGTAIRNPSGGSDGLLASGAGAFLDVRDSVIESNRAGVVVSTLAQAMISHTLLEANDSAGLLVTEQGRLFGRSVELRSNGLGAQVNEAVLDLESSLISGSLDDGLQALGGTINLRNVTIADNGLVGLNLIDQASTLVANAIFAGNGAGDLSGADSQYFFSNLISDGQLAGINGNLGGSAGFVDLDGGDYRLTADSQAVDSGDNSRVGNELDLSSHLRVFDGDNDQIAVVDRGALERGSDGGPRLIAPVLTSAVEQFSGIAFTNTAIDLKALKDGENGLQASSSRVSLKGYNSAGQLVGETSLEVAPGGQNAKVVAQLFDQRPDWIEVTPTGTGVKAFTLMGNVDLMLMDGSQLGTATAGQLLFPELRHGTGQVTTLRVVNPNDEPVSVRLRRVTAGGAQDVVRLIAGRGQWSDSVKALFESGAEGYVLVDSTPPQPLAGLEIFGTEQSVGGLWGLDVDAASAELFASHFAVGPEIATKLNIINFGLAGTVSLEALDAGGQLLAEVETHLGVGEQLRADVAELFSLSDFSGTGWVRIRSDSARLLGALTFEGSEGAFLASLPLQAAGAREFVFSHVAHNAEIFTGITLLNPNEEAALLELEVFDRDGLRTGRVFRRLLAGQKEALLLDEWIVGFASQLEGYVRVRSDVALLGFELFGGWDLEFLAAVPQQVVVQ